MKKYKKKKYKNFLIILHRWGKYEKKNIIIIKNNIFS